VSEPGRETGGPDRLTFLFGVHNHQPVANFDHVIAEATERAYHPFLALLEQFPDLPLTIHVSGSLLLWLRERASRTFDLLGTLAARGQVELLTGGFYEPILPVLPDWDKVGQIEALTEFVRVHFGVRPRGMWLAERVWEPHLPKILREAGVEYVLVDDSHFALAGLEPATLGGYFLTEEQGATLAVFPISQRLRYLVPFSEPEETLAFLAERRARATSLTLVDDGEKFGVWPGTHRLCHEGGWLRRFFEALLKTQWLQVSTLSGYLDRHQPVGRIYLPTAAYREMGEWALPAAAALELEEVKDRVLALPDGEKLGNLLRGGFWRNFLVKYPEVNDLYWKMLGLSLAIHEAIARRPADPRLGAARTQLWRGQGNDAYWHGVFGGCYLPHLRRGARQALIAADRLLQDATVGAPVTWSHRDLNGDGRAELLIRTPALTLTLQPEAGGSLSEIAYAPRALDLADVLTRRPEAYHGRVKAAAPGEDGGESAKTIHDKVAAKEPGLADLLAYDRFRRACLLDGLFPESGDLDPLHPWDAASVAFGDRPMEPLIRRFTGQVSVTFSFVNPDGCPILVEKTVGVQEDGAELSVTYRLRWNGTGRLSARWAVQWNLALTGGDLPERYYGFAGRPSLRSRGRATDQVKADLVDEWIGLDVALAWNRPAALGWAPVETVSLSEAGFERIFQGSALLLAWPLSLDPGGQWEERISLRIQDRGDSP
jgi:alpha-amylase